jgi:tetratricopeptide (TPR) repeat protein
VLGSEHPNTLTSRNNLALLYQSKGEYDKALPLYEQTLAAREQVLGSEHPQTITVRDNLERCRNEMEGKGEQAKPKS